MRVISLWYEVIKFVVYITLIVFVVLFLSYMWNTYILDLYFLAALIYVVLTVEKKYYMNHTSIDSINAKLLVA